MASVVTSNRLRELAGFRAEHGCAISLYLGLAPSAGVTVPDYLTRVNSLLDQAQKSAFAARADLSHDQKAGLERDFGRIRSFLSDEFDRSGVRGVGIFADSADGLWSVVTLPEQVADHVCVGRELQIAPLVPLLGRGDGVIVALVDRERGVLFKLAGGRLDELANLSEDQPGRHDQGGWSQARYQRHIDKLTDDHLRAVADDLDARIRAGGGKYVVVIGPDEARNEFCDLLAHETSERLVGATSGEGYATPTELLRLALPFVERAQRKEELELLARWQEEAGRDGRAASGWAETIEAATDGRVDVLLYQDGANRSVYVCPQDGRAQLEAGECALDGTPLERTDDGIDVAVRQTLAHGGRVRALARDRPELGPVEGIAALLRY
jgi:peptide chain release factor subunit 1